MQRDGLPDEFDRDREAFEDAQQVFEQQVRDALAWMLPTNFDVRLWTNAGEIGPSADCKMLAMRLAPRVAAAIQAGIDAAEADENITGISPNRAALSALRGETP